MSSIHSLFKSAVEQIMPDPEGDYFETHGTLSPEQFVHCGNILVNNCPSWMWDGGKKELRHNFLPDNKQFLYTTNILSNRTINKEVYQEHIVEEKNIEKDDWVMTNHLNIISSDSSKQKKPIPENDHLDNNIDFSIEIEEDPNTLQANDHDNNNSYTRKYDLYITYDKYYQTPKFWIFGYNYDNVPLGFKELMDDISSEYINKTVTYEYHPHLPILLVSLHPCRHGEVMKKLIKQYRDNNKSVSIDHYMFIFLKFISSVLPNINYDKTFDL